MERAAKTIRHPKRMWRIWSTLVSAIAASLGACGSPPPVVAPETDISNATGFENAVVVRLEEGPIDERSLDPSTLHQVDAVAAALRSSPQLQSALARVRVALFDAEQERVVANPVLDVVVRSASWGAPLDIEAGITERLGSLLTQRGRSDAADARLRSAAASAVTTALDVILQVRERYVDIQALERLKPLMEQRRTVLARVIDVARERLSAGEGTPNDVLTLESLAAELEVELADDELELRDARLALARLIGEPNADARWTVDPFTERIESRASEEETVAKALRRRPETWERKWEIAALESELGIAGLMSWEESNAGLSARNGVEAGAGPSLGVPLPFFDFGRVRRERVRARLSQAHHELSDTNRRVVEEVRRSLEALHAARSSLERVATRLLPLTEERRRKTEEIFVAGQVDVTALWLAEQDLQSANSKRVELEKRLALAHVRLERAVGGNGEIPPPILPNPISEESNEAQSP